MKKIIMCMTAILFLFGISVVPFSVDTARADDGPAEWAAKKVAKKIEDKVLAKKRADEAKAAKKKADAIAAENKKKADEAQAAKKKQEGLDKAAWIKAKIDKGESPHMTAAEIKQRKINRQWIVY